MKQGSVLLLALAAAVAGSISTAVLADQIYSWRDAAGHVHFSDQPPPADAKPRGLKSKESAVSSAAPQAAPTAAIPGSGANTPAATGTPPANGTPAKPKTLADRELEMKKRLADANAAKAKSEKDQQVAEQKQRDCERARNHQAALESGQRIARTNDKGEREFLDDGQREQDLQDTRRMLNQACK